MDDATNFLARSAPFFAQYWHYLLALLATVVVAAILAHLLAPTNQEKKPRDDHKDKDAAAAAKKKQPQDILSFDEGEHPLSEFDDEKPDPSLAPPLHAPDTPHVPYRPETLSEEEIKTRASEFYEQMNQRRSVRHFSSKPVPVEAIKSIVHTAGTSPSGAHSEPWTFVVVGDPQLKSQIRDIIEQEEYLNYDRRMGDKWVNELKFINTTHDKPYLETAPYLIVVFKQAYHIGENGQRHAHYYYEISTAIACGILVAAIHNAGLVTVTTTPLNAGVALRELLGRPENEKVMVLLPVGYPAEDATVPDVNRKPLEQIMVLK